MRRIIHREPEFANVCLLQNYCRVRLALIQFRNIITRNVLIHLQLIFGLYLWGNKEDLF